MKCKFLLIAFLYILPQTLCAQSAYPFGTILRKVYVGQSKSASNAVKGIILMQSKMKTDGTWEDIDYTDQAATQWKPAEHLDRVGDLVQAYTVEGSTRRNDEKLYQAIVLSLSSWYEKDPKSSNWWHNEIAVPQKLGGILIMMRYATQQLPGQLEEKLLERMKRGDMLSKTGANKTDIAIHCFYRALLTEDADLLAQSLTELFKPVSLVEGEEGLQYDYSYLQHGLQLYIGGYGNVFLGGVIKIAGYVAGTPYALPKEKLSLLSEFYRNTYLKTFRFKYVDFSTEGRGISRPDNLRKPSEKYRLEAMKRIDIAHGAEWDNEIMKVDSAVDFTAAPYHRFFWKADYTLHVRSGYTFSVRMASTRTKRTEMGNNENLYGKYLADGATNIQVNGPEYYNIMPVWEWDKIPGTTSPDHTEDIKMTVNWGEPGLNQFAGGVSDGFYGATAYQLNYEGLTAKKAWFFFDKEIVALGCDIKSLVPDPVITTVDQAWLDGNVNTSTGLVKKGEQIKTGSQPGSWILHNGVGYYFPAAVNVVVSTKEQSGSWNKINQSHSKENITGNVFKLYINHDVKPDTAGYEYVVLPGIKNMKSFNPSTIRIISNNSLNQAVYHEMLKILQVIFHNASTVHTEAYEVACDKPCVLMLKESKQGKIQISLAAPLQTAAKIGIKIKNLKNGKLAELAVEMPQGPLKGSTKEIEVSF